MKRRSIVTRIIAFIFISVIVFSAVSNYASVSFFMSRYEKELESKNVSLLKSARSEFETELKSLEVTIDNMALLTKSRFKDLTNKVPDMNLEEDYFYDLFIEYLMNADAYTSSIYIYFDPDLDQEVHDVWVTKDKYGDIQRQEEIPIERYEENDNMTWFYGPKEAEEAYWVEPYFNRYDQFITSYVSPIFVEGVFVGIIGGYLDLSVLSDRLNSKPVNQGESFFVINKERQIIYHPNYKEGTLIDDIIVFGDTIEVDGQDRLVDFSTNAIKNDERFIIHFSRVYNGWIFAYAIPKSLTQRLLRSFIIKLLVTFAVSFFFLLVCAFIYGYRFKKRFNRILSYLDRIKNGESNLVIPIRTYDEVGEMVSVINETNISLNHLMAEKNNLAYYQQITKLPNRNSLRLELNKLMARLDNKDRICLMYIDVDSFRSINELIGYKQGNKLIQIIAEILGRYCNENINLYHTNVDEFAFVIQGITQEEEIISMSEHILNHFGRNYTIGMHSVYLTMSIGIARNTHEIDDVSNFFRIADIATNEAKLKGRNKSVMYNEQMYLKVVKYNQLEKDFETAMIEKQFELYYQPQIRLKNDVIDSVEALVRWNHPQKGLLLPNYFIEYAEKTGFINKLGDLVLEMACQQVREWDLLGLDHLRVSVNVSRIQLNEVDFEEKVMYIIEREKVNPSKIELEITESVLIDNKDIILKKLKTLKEYGIYISVDDYGVGYSALSTLIEFPIHEVKIDKSIIDQISTIKSTVIVESTIALAHKLGLEVVAEGIEQKEQVEVLKELECDYIQGYYYAKPMPATKAYNYIVDYSKKD